MPGMFIPGHTWTVVSEEKYGARRGVYADEAGAREALEKASQTPSTPLFCSFRIILSYVVFLLLRWTRSSPDQTLARAGQKQRRNGAITGLRLGRWPAAYH